ncbi:MAG TPA: hypothetical protein VIG08_08680 [Gemmatimonadales bacterium]|jgi:hypothetical protein
MFATIRTYTPKPDSMTAAKVDQLRIQLHDGFLPIAQKIHGFHGYYALNVDGKKLITISLFYNQAGAAESTRRAAEFVKQNPLPFDPGTPEVSEGEVVTYAEAGVGAH